MATSPEYNDDCIELDYRFSTNVSPDELEAAELVAQDLCQGLIGGEPCYYKLSSPDGHPCERQTASLKAFGNLATGVLFEDIVNRQFNNDTE